MHRPEPENEAARLDRGVQQRLGSRLRTLYRGVVGAPVPQEQIEFVLALRRIERERRRDEAV